LFYKHFCDVSSNGRLLRHFVKRGKASPATDKCLIWPFPKTLSYQLVPSTLDETRPPLNASPIFLTTILVRFLSGSLLGLVAVGLGAYGLYQVLVAYYRRIPEA
jgi:hypothetical protein